MSAPGIPYHLRPHKAVDRRLFVDLLNRFERWRSLNDYGYFSMGAYPLEDHKLIHRLLGLTKMVAFDMDESVVARQKFNRPFDGCLCIQKTATELVSGFDALLQQLGFGPDVGVIVWLDYTNPKELARQLADFETLLDTLAPNDVVRVTVNAHPPALGDSRRDGKIIAGEELKAARLEALRDRIGELLPSWVEPDDMTSDRLPGVLASAFAVAASRAFPPAHPNAFQPLSIVRYADGQQMLSVTGVVTPREESADLLQHLDLANWAFASTDWQTVHKLVAADLTIRERLLLERGIVNDTPENLIAELGFNVAADVELSELLESYRKYYRFYPSLIAMQF